MSDTLFSEASTAISLRPYQEEAIEAVLEHENDGVRKQMVVLPTGAGKTICFADLARRKNVKTLVLAHRDELIRQAVEKISLVWPRADIGVIKAERNEYDHQVVVASVQSLARESRLNRMRRDFELIIVDESHHSRADSYEKVLRHFGCFDSVGPLLVGYTATPDRGDKGALDHIFDKIVFHRDIRWGIKEGYLSDLKAIQIQLQIDLDSVKTHKGDYQDGALGKALMDADAPDRAVEAWKEHASDRKTLAFSPTVGTAVALAEAFRSEGVDAEWISGAMPLDQRRTILQRYTYGEFPVLSNCMIATEGYDEPSIDCILMMRPTKSRPLYQQCIGRASRRFPGKENALILDMVGVTRRHKLITAASLLGLDPQAVQKQGAKLGIAIQDAPEPITVKGRIVANEVDLWGSIKDAELAWVRTTSGFALSMTDRTVSLQRVGEGWGAIIRRRGEPDTIISQTKQGLDLELAQGVAEDYARKNQQQGDVLLSRAAGWRQKPATPKQIEALEKWGFRVPEGMTAGEASDKMTAYVATRRRRRN